MKNKFLVVLLVILTIVILGLPLYFFLTQNTIVVNKSKPKVAVTIFPIYDIVKNIAGDKVDVTLVLPIGTSVHTFEPKPTDIAKLENVQLVFKVGVGLDDWVEKMVPPNVSRVDLSASVNLLKSTDLEDGVYDPHYWLSVDNALLIAIKVKNEMVTLDPENAAYYENNLSSYSKQLDKLEKYINSELKDEKGKGIVTFHNAFTYFAYDNGIDILATIEPFPGKEPTPIYLKQVLQVIENNNVKVLFKEPQLSNSLLTSFVNDLGVKILTLDPLGGNENTDTYIKMMKYNTNEIKKGLSL